MRFLKTEAGAVILWILGIILLAAILFPWIYQGGKAFADHAATNELPAVLESIGGSAGRADADTYFSRSLYLSVLLLLTPLILRLKTIRRLSAPLPLLPPGRLPWKTRLTHLTTAFLLAAGLLWILGHFLEAGGAFLPEPDPPATSRILKKSLIPAISAAVIEELLFRGLLLGVWLRIARPLPAALSVSAIFAFVHFLQPPAHADIANPASATAGFELLGLILLHFLNPSFIAAELALLFTVGMILAFTRLRTGSLWFPVGLHAGWIFAFKGFNMLHDNSPTTLRPLWIGETLRSGLFPLFTLFLTAGICHLILKSRKAPDLSPRS